MFAPPRSAARLPDERNKALKYVLLIYQPDPFNFRSLPESEQHEIGAAYGALNNTENVEPGLPLGLPNDAVTIRVSDGKAQTSNGPYVNAAGLLAGIISSRRKARSTRWQSQPACRPRLGGAVEVRPAQSYW